MGIVVFGAGVELPLVAEPGYLSLVMPAHAHLPLLARRLAPFFGVALVLLWATYALVPEWTGSRAAPERVDLHIRDRLVHENRYTSGWLTRYAQTWGSLPSVLPPNRAAAGNRQWVERCPKNRQDLISRHVDWAWCKEDNTVYAMFLNPGYLTSISPPPYPTLFPRRKP